jgi:hypothetical protein
MHNVRDHKRRATLDFDLYHFFRFGVMPLCSLAGSGDILPITMTVDRGFEQGEYNWKSSKT